MTTVPADISNNKLFVNTHLDHGTKTRFVDSEFFKVDCYKMKEGENIIKNDAPFQLVSIIGGEGLMDGMEVKMGDHFVICSDKDETVFDGNMEVMITTL